MVTEFYFIMYVHHISRSLPLREKNPQDWWMITINEKIKVITVPKATALQIKHHNISFFLNVTEVITGIKIIVLCSLVELWLGNTKL